MKGLLNWISATSVFLVSSNSITKDAVIKDKDIIIESSQYHITRLKSDSTKLHKDNINLTQSHEVKDSIINDQQKFIFKTLQEKDSLHESAKLWKFKAIALENKELKTVEIQLVDKKYRVIATGKGRYNDVTKELNIPIQFIPDSVFNDTLKYSYSNNRSYTIKTK